MPFLERLVSREDCPDRPLSAASRNLAHRGQMDLHMSPALKSFQCARAAHIAEPCQKHKANPLGEADQRHRMPERP